jgi:hypothetical protein
VRIAKIVQLIRESQYAICDLSRIEGARLNMAFETGLVWGAMYYGGKKQQSKDLLVLDARKHQYQKTLSDLGGVDGAIHGNRAGKAIGNVRQFLASKSKDSSIPGEAFILRRFRRFQADLKRMTAAPGARFEAKELGDLKYVPELINTMVEWQKLPDRAPDPGGHSRAQFV